MTTADDGFQRPEHTQHREAERLHLRGRRLRADQLRGERDVGGEALVPIGPERLHGLKHARDGWVGSGDKTPWRGLSRRTKRGNVLRLAPGSGVLSYGGVQSSHSWR